MKELRAEAQKKTIKTKDGHQIAYAEFYASESKALIDRIDRLSAKHYGFSREALDFVTKYLTKFHIGPGGTEGTG